MLDLRLPMGLMFTLVGAMLLAYGLYARLTDTAAFYARLSNGVRININLWWGLALLAFGVVMLALAWRAGKDDSP